MLTYWIISLYSSFRKTQAHPMLIQWIFAIHSFAFHSFSYLIVSHSVKIINEHSIKINQFSIVHSLSILMKSPTISLCLLQAVNHPLSWGSVVYMLPTHSSVSSCLGYQLSHCGFTLLAFKWPLFYFIMVPKYKSNGTGNSDRPKEA